MGWGHGVHTEPSLLSGVLGTGLPGLGTDKLQYSGHLMRRADSFEKTLNLGLLHYRQILYHLSHQRSPGAIKKGQASLSITNSWGIPKLMSIGSVMPSNHLILCHPLLLLPSIFPGIKGVAVPAASGELSLALENPGERV